ELYRPGCCRRPAGGMSRRPRHSRRSSRRRVAAELGRDRNRTACLLAQRLCLLPSLHRDHTVGEITALVDRMRASALIAQPGYGGDADRHDVFAELADRDFLRCAWSVGPADATPFGELAGPALEIEATADANQVMYLPFTSGTTGEPKGVMH